LQNTVPHYKLTYFPFRGRGEFIRYIFALAEVPYEDHTITYEDWPNHKAEMPFGTMPLLDIDNGREWIGQSLTIARYLARRFGFAGKNMLDQAKADMYAEGIADVVNTSEAFLMSLFMNSPEKDDVFRNWKTKSIVPFLERYEKFLKANNSGWLVGDSVTWADLYLAEFLDRLNMWDPDHHVLDHYPSLHALVDRVNHIPQIAQRISSRPFMPL